MILNRNGDWVPWITYPSQPEAEDYAHWLYATWPGEPIKVGILRSNE